ncbi:MAG: phosphatidate cytidylyltransferase [Gammaproteobacteria bacterium]|nr:phosphatidate cytidylyltransferase [Gammaproteobacteria bacterium]
MLKIRILTASVLGAALLVCLFWLPAPWTVLVFGAVFTFAAWEWTGFGSMHSAAARIAYTAAISVLLALSWLWSASPSRLLWLLGFGCAWWGVAFLWVTLAPGRHRPTAALCCGVPVLVPAFVALARIQVATRGFARGPEMVLWMLLLVFAADIGAFFTGRSLGRHKLAPRVSPGKTWEGAIGGLAAVILIALIGTLHFGLPVSGGIVFGCAVGIFSIIGDLTESMFKRGAGLKDSGNWLPGHGGIMDRIDSVTAAAPLYALGLFGSGVIV